MKNNKVLNKIINTIKTTFPDLKGSKFINNIGRADVDNSMGVMVDSDIGVFFIDVNYILKNNDIEIIKIIDRTTGKVYY